MLELSFITVATGLVLLVATLGVAYVEEGQPARYVMFIAGAFLFYVLVLASIPAALLGQWHSPLAAVIEEPLKLAVIVRIGARGRMAVVVTVAFAACELLDKATIPLLAGAVSDSSILAWMLIVLSPVLMHAATGVIYSVRTSVHTGLLLIAAIIVHSAYNFAVGFGVDFLARFGSAVLEVAAVIACASIALIAATAVRAWALRQAAAS